MSRYWSWGRAPLLSALMISVLLFFAPRSAATRTRASQLYCLSTEIEPYGLINCIIEVRNEYQQPTLSFDPSDFIVVVRISNAGAVVKKSALARGSVVTTAVFNLSVSAGTDVLIRVYLREKSSIGDTSDMRKVRGSGITVSVLPWPASLLGPITCTAPSEGLALRSCTVCRATLYNENNALSAVHSANVLFSEASRLGSFAFMSGSRELVFRFTAPPTAPMSVSNFTLKAVLRGKDARANTSVAQAVHIPLLYPVEVALSGATNLHCIAERSPITCYITASDTQGPVHFNITHFRVRLERSVDDVAAAADTQDVFAADGSRAAVRDWADVTDTFDLSVTSSPLRPYVGVVSWVPKSNTAIYEARLRVYASMYGQEIGVGSGGNAFAAGNAADVAGSPYSFTTGMLPNAPSVTLRGCRESIIVSGNTTVCFIDLANGVSGDTSFYLITTLTQRSRVSNVTYVEYDAACMCPSLWFTYHAPTALISRVYDYIKVSVYTDVQRSANVMAAVNNAPLRLEVVPVASGSGHDKPASSTNTFLVLAGLLFYGSVLLVGGAFIVRRSYKSARIRHERAVKERAMMQGMDARRGVPTASAEDITNISSARTGAPAVEEAATGASGGYAVVVRGGAGWNAPRYEAIHMLDAGYEGVGSGGSSSVSPPPASAAVVSNVAVPQDRFHSDSD